MSNLNKNNKINNYPKKIKWKIIQNNNNNSKIQNQQIIKINQMKLKLILHKKK